MIRHLIAGILLLSASGTWAADEDSSIDRLLDSSGLESLDGEERASARALIRGILSHQASSETLSESARNYMRNEGYEPVHLEMAEVNGTSYLIATTGYTTYATSDIPILLSPWSFQSGEYFAKKQIFGGVSEFIDRSGDSRRLLFAKWFEVK